MLVRLLVLLAALLTTLAFAQDRKIKVGDTLAMTCEEEATLNKKYTVTQQGVVLVDFIGAVHVEGNTEAEAARIISARLVNERILRTATVTIKIAGTVQEPVTFRGAVKVTGQEPFKEGMRLSDIVRRAQADQQTDLTRVEVRSRDGSTRLVDFARFDPATNENNPLLKPGDTVTFVKKGAPGLVVLLGGVERPGGVTYEPGMTVRKAIEKAGGLTTLAVSTTVRLERQGRPPQILDLSNPTVDASVLEGDRIIVSVRGNRLYVQVSGAVNRGGFIEYRERMTLLQAVQGAGGLRADALKDRVYVTRNGESKATRHNLDLIGPGSAADTVLNPGDKVMVEARSSRKTDVLRYLTVLALLFIFIGQ